MRNRSSSSVRVSYPRHSREQLVGLLRQSLPALAATLPLRRVTLFGSWARNRATAASDIDLLVIYSDPPRVDAYVVVRRQLTLRAIEPHVYSESEAQRIAQTIERMTRGGIELL